MFELAAPWVFLALPLPILVYLYGSRTSSNEDPALYVPFFNQLKNNLPSSTPSSHLSLKSLIAVWCLLILAASGPRFIGPPIAMTHQGHSILLALDISDSMAIDDFIHQGRISSRIEVVKETANAFVHARQNDQLGLILFGSRAYLQTPLTFDKQTLHERIDDATVGLAGHSTSIGDALGLAIKHLKDTPDKGRVVILLTDGANNSGVLSPLKAADLAHDNHIKVYTIGLGSAFQFDEETLQTLAKKTGGLYFSATDVASLEATYQQINAMETTEQNSTVIHPKNEYYPWPLGLALLIFTLSQLNVTHSLWRKRP
ncbi:MAG: VWA domain-containing protein [Legionellaceae bacterium]